MTYSVKTTSKENKDRILKAVKEKNQIKYKGKPIKWAWNEVFCTLKENNFSPRVFYPAKLSFKIEGGIKIFHDKQKLKQYMNIKEPL
jgi:hypothetical protein